MAPLADNVTSDSLVLWNIIDVHFDELEFGLEQFERVLEHPVHTLGDLARYPDLAIEAHVDGLAVGGEEVRQKLLIPALLCAPESPTRAMGAALAILAANRFDVVWQAIQSEDASVRRAVARAAAFDAPASLDAWIVDKLSRTQSPRALHGLLDLCAARRLSPPDLTALLRSDDPSVLATAARAALHGEPSTYRPLVEALLEHEDPEVGDAALLAALTWRSTSGWRKCQNDALEPAQPLARTTARYAALGGKKHHERLRERLPDDASRSAALFGLGFSGNPAIVAELVPYLRSKRLLEVNLAAQSISLITGLDLEGKGIRIDRPSPEVVVVPPPEADPEALAALPAFEDDDLDADLVPQPEELLPELDVSAIEQHAKRLTLDPSQRWLGGAPFAADTLIDYLDRAPMRRRHPLADALGIQTGGAVWFDSRAPARRQRVQLALLRTRDLTSLFRCYHAW